MCICKVFKASLALNSALRYLMNALTIRKAIFIPVSRTHRHAMIANAKTEAVYLVPCAVLAAG